MLNYHDMNQIISSFDESPMNWTNCVR